MLKGYGGEVFINGRELRQWKTDLYYQIGVGFELPNHYGKLSAFENLAFFASFYQNKVSISEKRIMMLLERVGLGAAAHKKTADFSKGMKMRLNFIRALLHNPPILFLDEPTSGLDPVNAKIIKDMIAELVQEGKTIMLTTHHMHDAEQLCHRLAFMIEGKLPLIESPKKLKLQYGKRLLEIEYGNPTQKKVFNLDNLPKEEALPILLKTEYIHSIHSQEATLEDIFIEVTGKKLVI